MAGFSPDTTNEFFQLASELVNETSRNLFLTGKAGTGKTTFLKYIRENCPKQMAIVAPTGVAAINAGGVTIHSFFQIPPGLFLPTLQRIDFSDSGTEVHNRHSLVARLRFNNDKRKLLRQLELLVIDEVSMVRCDLLDAIDTILRSVRKRPYERFGGVQVLFIGDLYQLPPVTRGNEWSKLAAYYNSPFFFDSEVLKEELPLYIEFEKIYRQSDERFIGLLNQVRNNELNPDGRAILETRYDPAFGRKDNDGYIILTTHNEQARNINAAQLQKIETVPTQYAAVIEGDFPENAYPADKDLQVKIGAQVMFIKNDIADRGKRYFNGRIGRVSRLEDDRIFVLCEDEAEIEVEREKWKNIRYTINKTTQQMEEDVLGSFSQFPLRLAWAITVHKSQGLTFDKAIIDAGEAFAPGQVYVALSRCTNLDGLVLKSRLRTNSLLTDPRVTEFSRNIATSAWLQQELLKEKKQYREKLLIRSFDFSAVRNGCHLLKEYLLENKDSFNPESLVWTEQLNVRVNGIQDTALKFHAWLREQFLLTATENTMLRDRISRATLHFLKETESTIQEINQSPAITDSKLHAKEYNEGLKDVFTQLSLGVHLLKGVNEHFDSVSWHHRRRSFTPPVFTLNAYAGLSRKFVESPYPALYKQLKELRDSICHKRDLPVYMVLGGTTLDEMTRYLPQSLTEMKKISGFGDTKLELYGQQFLDIILEFCSEEGLESHIHEKIPKRERKPRPATQRKKGDTHAESFRLYKTGKSIEDIAKERKLSLNTIEGHLSKFIRNGEIGINEFVDLVKVSLIEAALRDFDGGSITPIKQKLPPEISFGQIRMVMAGLGISPQQSAD